MEKPGTRDRHKAAFGLMPIEPFDHSYAPFIIHALVVCAFGRRLFILALDKTLHRTIGTGWDLAVDSG